MFPIVVVVVKIGSQFCLSYEETAAGATRCARQQDAMATEDTNPYDSFAPMRTGCNAKWHVNGEETFAAIADALDEATSEVLIAGWWLAPWIYLRRNRDVPAERCTSSLVSWIDLMCWCRSRLDFMLRSCASRGVMVYVLLWNEAKVSL